ncbi:3',5'-cyclic-nucleotide phosphodiesterase [Chitinilyticum piscinae]|uniref:3',5'-cyclic-nucleotide phosphodiesterase n=1 Tax=Chitinilyticum piscinae TaxID=2866724 RepID=A0A8J7FZ26_9NEIS|nr:3',5'-cyclic-nucleotide phosphodiesterase [Chitinilyticum piscinae]MBE9608975.1 3',5'-cyclic-nucleotide phosphodiesterase [Chitinilyticum piscinae]
MELRVLGCSGGIGGANRTTAYLLGAHVLVDAGTGVGELNFTELCAIDHVFLSHAHLDHVACLPMLLDTVLTARQRPVTVHALPETLHVLQQHLFNWQLWPDFSVIPSEAEGILRYAPISVGESVVLDGVSVTALPALHTIPAIGYQLDSGTSSVVYSGDTVGCPAFWQAVNAIGNLGAVIIETAFANHEAELASLARHLCPASLARELCNLEHDAEVLITHLKPADSGRTLREIHELDSRHAIRPLLQGETIQF